MKQLHPGCALALLALLTAASVAAAQRKAPDQEFFDKAAVAGLYEVKAGELGRKNGSSNDVRSFGTMMVNDHGNANDKLKALASKKGVVLPAKLDATHQNKIDKLAKEQPGKAFDEEFADQMEASHGQAVKLFEKALKGAKDPDVRAFAAATLPTLRSHNQLAEALDRKDIAP